MKEKWTGDLVGRMHNAGVTQEELAEELGITKAYVSMILNSKRTPPDAKKRLEDAFQSVLKHKSSTKTE